jgi:hypothetical protein
MAGAETIISLGVIVVMKRAGQVLAYTYPALTPSQPLEDTMLEADQAYLAENSPAMLVLCQRGLQRGSKSLQASNSNHRGLEIRWLELRQSYRLA